MRGRFAAKIESRRGASIAMALFLFLVCSVIGAIVLVAGTAATGNLRSMVKMDQRYYSVTSAAELFRDTLNGQSCTVTRTRSTTASDTVTLDENGNELSNSFSSQTGEPIYGFPSASGSLLSQAAQRFVYGAATLDADKWSAAPGHAGSWTLTVTPDNANALPVSVNAEMQADGDLLLKFTNADTDSANERFTLTITLDADVVDNSDTPALQTDTKQNKTDWIDEKTCTIETETTTTEIKTTTLTWTILEAGKVVSAPAQTGGA